MSEWQQFDEFENFSLDIENVNTSFSQTFYKYQQESRSIYIRLQKNSSIGI